MRVTRSPAEQGPFVPARSMAVSVCVVVYSESYDVHGQKHGMLISQSGGETLRQREIQFPAGRNQTKQGEQ